MTPTEPSFPNQSGHCRDTKGSADAIFRQLDRPIWIITAAANKPSSAAQEQARLPRSQGGLVATWVSQASLDFDFPVLSVGLAPNHFTARLVDLSGRFVAHLLPPSMTDLALNFAIGSGADRDKFEGLETIELESGSVVLSQAAAWMECEVLARLNGGDRLYFWGRVCSANHASNFELMHERHLFSAATEEQKQKLNANLQDDVKLHRPWFDKWVSDLPKELRPMNK